MDGLSTTDRKQAEGMACPLWQQQATVSATADNHILLKKLHLLSEILTKLRTNTVVTAPDSHPVFILIM